MKNSIIRKAKVSYLGNQYLLGVSFDEKTRRSIADEVEKILNPKDSDHYKILIVGSPNAWEIRDIDSSITNKTKIVCVDLGDMTNFVETARNFLDSAFYSRNFFSFNHEDKFDLVVNRWHFHHLTTQQKRDFYKKCRSHLKENGSVITVDYFFNNFDSIEEKIKVGLDHMRYRRTKSNPPFDDPSDEKLIIQILNCDVDDHRGGKMDSVKNVLQYAAESNYTSESKFTYDSLDYDRPDLWGQYMITSRKND